MQIGTHVPGPLHNTLKKHKVEGQINIQNTNLKEAFEIKNSHILGEIFIILCLALFLVKI